MSLFRTLLVYHDSVFRSAAMNMAIDEALLESVVEPSIRFYRWNSPALSFGYFGRFAEIAAYSHERDLVRRWTGGGVVFHGSDLTYSIAIPGSNAAFRESSLSIYERVHQALSSALVTADQLSLAMVCDRRADNATVIDRRYSRDACFANPVYGDLMLKGRKIAGAAQRRTRGGLLQQGSIQNVAIGDDCPERFANELAEVIHRIDLDPAVLARAAELAQHRYATRAWLERR